MAVDTALICTLSPVGGTVITVWFKYAPHQAPCIDIASRERGRSYTPCARFEVFTAVKIEVSSFSGLLRLHLQGEGGVVTIQKIST
jgi:hypothetical protein